MTRYLELLAAAVLGATLALAGAHWWTGAADSAEPGRAAETRDDLLSAQELRDALEREATQRETLASELELMRTVVESLATASASGSRDSQARATNSAAARDDEDAGPPTPNRAPGLQFEEERLTALGMLEGEVAELRRLWDDAQLAKLELSDRATREGWLMRPGHRNQAARIEQQLRERIGEDAYDKLLYATNQLNRTEVKQVLGGSEAASAGLQAGDHLLSYGGVRIFKPADLRKATTSGTRGEQVRLVVDRGGSTFSVGVPRGPLGVLLNAKSSPPR